MKRLRPKGIPGILTGLGLGFFLAGCGNGITGDLPPVTGQVFRTDTEEFLAEAQVTLTTERGQQFVASTDAEGRFSFPGVASSHYELLVEPPAGLSADGLETQQIRFGEGATFMAIGLPPPPLSAPSGAPTEIHIEPLERIVFLEPQPQTIRFSARITGENVAELRPHWLVRGAIGRIDLQGVFTPTQEGTGWVIAQIGDLEAVALIRVERRPPARGSRPASPSQTAVHGLR